MLAIAPPALLTIADLIATRDRRCLDAARGLREAMRADLSERKDLRVLASTLE